MKKIVLERAKCIGCGSCTQVCPKFFEMGEDGKSVLKGAAPENEEQIQELELENPECAVDAEEVCPAQAIRVE